MAKHTILFLAANPSGTDRRALDREAHSIRVELKRTGYRDCFELETRWAATPLDLLRELRERPAAPRARWSGSPQPPFGSAATCTATRSLVTQPDGLSDPGARLEEV